MFSIFVACGIDTPIWGILSAGLRSGFGSAGFAEIRMPELVLSGMVIMTVVPLPNHGIALGIINQSVNVHSHPAAKNKVGL